MIHIEMRQCAEPPTLHRITNMPTSPTAACTTPRCPRRAKPNEWGLVKCAERAAQRARHYGPKRETRTPERRRADRRMYGPEWKRIRARVLKRWPHCNRCGAPGTDEWSNLQSFCHSCHSRKTVRGGWPPMEQTAGSSGAAWG